MTNVRDWGEWHRRYDEDGSTQARRLAVVVEMTGQVLDEAPAGPIRLLSLCAGEGRDLAQALAAHPRRGDVTGLMVEADAELAATAEANLGAIGANLAVRCSDAGAPASFAGAVPVDLLMLCGIFGNVSVADIATTIAAAPGLCRPGAAVLWTRHRRYPDITPWVRQRFFDVGCPPARFASSGPGGFAVGHQVFTGSTPARSTLTTSDRLFTFTTTAEAWGRPPGNQTPAR